MLEQIVCNVETRSTLKDFNLYAEGAAFKQSLSVLYYGVVGRN